MMKNQSFQSSDQLDILAKKALEENTKNRKITIVYPKCLKTLTMNTTNKWIKKGGIL